MEWFPKINLSEEHDKWLSDIELRRVKQLKESLRLLPSGPKSVEIEEEIYKIYLTAVQRHKKDEEGNGGLRDWLNVEELVKVDELKDKIKVTENEKSIFRYEAMLYEVYFESICRQTDFSLKEQVGKYIEMMKVCESEREAEILSTVIVDLLRTAR